MQEVQNKGSIYEMGRKRGLYELEKIKIYLINHATQMTTDLMVHVIKIIDITL
jgi:hypothetical protein